MYIILFDRGDRLGANISNYLAQILYAHKNKIIIKFKNNSKTNYRYYMSSIFIKILFNYIDEYNKKLCCEITDDILFNFDNQGDYFLNISFTLQDIKNDYVSYFKKFIYDDKKLDILNVKNIYNNIPFDINKTILVHLRLDDCRYSSDYDGRICSYVFQTSINNDIIADNNLHNNLTNKIRCNGQAPINFNRIQEQIDKALLKYPDYEVIIITNPGENLNNIPYRKIQNYDESYDLFLLCNSDVLIMSRSTYSLCPLFFGIVKDAYIPLWGHLPCFGLYTKYDHNNFNYFY